ncbi:glycosyltransferase [Anoxynatronum buryatiense]|uniref:Glycosyltransferase involved in cell wall bisynthesis n=1 Tax=Anoxynatronum buryatiense TaxID=489973 RepID=A0AA46AJ62_9CLOT|nr:glycosyltransferase [Anoxynatronum buryatiense]SMP56756.1 Glycosyltransferase involved in cell wall bisynthesis [Anoxynatronum buryatiense]
MKVLFAHDHKIRLIDGKHYTPGGLPNDVLRRYTEKFGDLTLLTRIYEEEHASNSYKEISINKIRFLNYFEGRYKQVKHAVQGTDILIARLPSWIGCLAVHYAKVFNKPYLLEVVGDPKTAYSLYGSIRGKLIAPFMSSVMKYQVKHAPFVLYVSKRFLQERYPTNGNSVGCPDVYLEEPSLEALDERLSKISEQEFNSVVLGLIGSLEVSYRGHKTLLKVANELKKRDIYCIIRFLGGGSNDKWTNMAEKLGIKDQITFNGILPAGFPVLKWIDDIDILVMPSEAETLGRAIIEAMSRGCPVIGSLETAIGEQIGSDCLCSAQDYIAIANLIERMISDREYMSYCAKENFYRSFKYTNTQTERIRSGFFDKFLSTINIDR